MSDLKAKIWEGDTDAIRLTKNKVNAEMLSLYMSFFHKQTSLGKVWYTVVMSWYAVLLFINKDKLNNLEIDVLLNFLLRVPIIPKHTNSFVKLAQREMSIAVNRPYAHEKALGLITLAQTLASNNRNKYKFGIYQNIDTALKLEPEIRAENTIQSLRQLVRIFKSAGILFGKLGYCTEESMFLRRALSLAEGEANSPNEVEKISVLIAKL